MSILLLTAVLSGPVTIVWDHDNALFERAYFVTRTETVRNAPWTSGGFTLASRQQVLEEPLRFAFDPAAVFIPNFSVPVPAFAIDTGSIRSSWTQSYLNETSFPGLGVGSFEVFLPASYSQVEPFMPLGGELLVTFADGSQLRGLPVLVRVPEPSSVRHMAVACLLFLVLMLSRYMES